MKRLCFYITTLLCLFAFSKSFANDHLVVVVNKNNPITNLSLSELSNIYHGKTKIWNNGKRIVIVNQAIGTNQRKTFYTRALNTDPTVKFYIPNTMAPVRTIIQRSDKAVLKFVANMKNAIGYIYAGSLDNTVKAITINRKKFIE